MKLRQGHQRAGASMRAVRRERLRCMHAFVGTRALYREYPWLSPVWTPEEIEAAKMRAEVLWRWLQEAGL